MDSSHTVSKSSHVPYFDMQKFSDQPNLTKAFQIFQLVIGGTLSGFGAAKIANVVEVYTGSLLLSTWAGATVLMVGCVAIWTLFKHQVHVPDVKKEVPVEKSPKRVEEEVKKAPTFKKDEKKDTSEVITTDSKAELKTNKAPDYFNAVMESLKKSGTSIRVTEEIVLDGKKFIVCVGDSYVSDTGKEYLKKFFGADTPKKYKFNLAILHNKRVIEPGKRGSWVLARADKSLSQEVKLAIATLEDVINTEHDSSDISYDKLKKSIPDFELAMYSLPKPKIA